MVIRLLLRLLGNNERLIQKLSESVPIQAAARVLVSVFYKTKSIAEEKGIPQKLDQERAKQFVRRLSQHLKEEYELKKEHFKKK